MFFNLVTLTFELVRDIIKVNVPTNFRVHVSNCSTVRALNNGQTDTPDRFYTLDR